LIQRGIVTGLCTGGTDVIDCGVTSTPATLVALKKLRHNAAIVVTGSHVPPPTTGILFFLDDTGEMDELGEESVESILRSEQWRKAPAADVGSVETLDVLEIYEEQMRQFLGGIGDYRIVVDAGNGAAWATLPKVLMNAGCQVTTINGIPDGTFPSRSPHPQPSSLMELARVVKETKADLGVGTDSDGDRALFATAGGEVLWGDITSAILARSELKAQGGGRIIITINTSSLVQYVAVKLGGKVVATKVGPPAMAQALRKYSDAIFATEESGKHIWPGILLYGDAALATGKLLRTMREEQKSLEELHHALPRFHQLKSTVPCPEQLKAEALRNILETWKSKGEGEVLTVDGLKVTYPNLSWFLIRPSGTEAVFRCHSESPDRDEARRLILEAEEYVHQGIERAKVQFNAKSLGA
jgi:phosphomannomutase